MTNLKTLHGTIKLPTFMPDATYGAIQTLSFDDVANVGVEAIVTNTLHILLQPGDKYIKDFGGIHKFYNWNKTIETDSGGFQVFSLIHKNGLGMLTDDGAIFKSPLNGSTHELTPEKSQQIQHNLGSDIRIVLDDCRAHDINRKEAEEAVERTIRWAQRSKDEFLRLNTLTEDEFSNSNGSTRPLLFAVIQGGSFVDLRKHCAEELVKIGFDGYGFGGYPLDENKILAEEVLKTTVDVIPENKIRYAMGVGTPDDIHKCINMGYNFFDTVLPTRNARHGYLFTSNGVVRLKNNQYAMDDTVIDSQCDCVACTNGYSKAYLRHLIKIKEPAGFRLTTMHNLRFYMKNISSHHKAQ